MTDDQPRTVGSYSLEIQPPAAPGGTYQWVIRRQGKLLKRSDMGQRSEAKAREKGEETLARLLRDR